MTDDAKMRDVEVTRPEQKIIEDLPLAERAKLAESFDPYKGIEPGWHIDARDTINNWCVAEVLKVNGGEIKVNFDGWSNKYDEVF